MIKSKELAPIKEQATKSLTYAQALEIQTESNMYEAVEELSQIKTIQKSVKEKKESITKPLMESLKNIRSLFAPIENACELAEGIIKEKMVKYKELSQKDDPMGQNKFDGVVGSVVFKRISDVEIVKESDIPRQYLVPDMVKIRRDLLAGKKIKGVKLVEKTITSAK